MTEVEEKASIQDDTITTQESPSSTTPSSSSSSSKFQTAIHSLSSILKKIPPSILSSQDPPYTLLHDPDISHEITTLLHQPDSGSGDNNLCRWFYDTFLSSEPQLQLIVLRFLPIISGLYLSRIHLKKPLAGFEAVLLALYAYETTSRGGQAVTLSVPDLSHPSIYHNPTKDFQKSNNNSNSNNINATELSLAVVSPSLEPHGTVRSTRRARIVGVALELYYRKIALMPVRSKIDFCEFCELWAGQDGDMYKDDHLPMPSDQGEDKEKKNKKNGNKKGRIHLPWELLQPVLRILGHCLLGPNNCKDKELYDKACSACRSLYARSLHDVDPNAILATRSLLRLVKMAADPKNDVDHTEIVMTDVITL